MGTVDLTKGSVAGCVARFALPLAGTSVVQQLYPTVDLLFVGNVLGTSATAALGVGSLLITLAIGLFTGVSAGVNVKLANTFGAGDEAALRRAAGTSLALALVSGIVLALLCLVLASPYVDAMDVPPESAADALDYLLFASAAVFPIGVFNICSGALRGMGDAKSPLAAQAAGGLLNIAANWMALCVLGRGIVGCAEATLASNGLAAAAAAIMLVRRGGLIEKRPDRGSLGRGVDTRDGLASCMPDLRFVWNVVAFGAPVALQTVAITLSNVAIQHQVDLLGVETVAAFTVYLKVELPIYLVILAIGQATTTFVAQNHGAGMRARCDEGARTCQVLCIALTVALSAAMLLVGRWAFCLFDHSEDVIGVGVPIISITFPFYFVYAVLEVQADAMRGFGRSLGPAIVVLANICILRVVLVNVLAGCGLGIEAIAATYPVTWAAAALCMVALRRFDRRSQA